MVVVAGTLTVFAVVWSRAVAGPVVQTSWVVLAAALLTGAMLASTAASLNSGWVLWQRGLMFLAVLATAYPAWWAVATLASHHQPDTPLSWLTGVVAGVGHLPLIAAFSLIPLLAIDYLGRTTSRAPLVLVAALGVAAIVSFVLFFDDFAPLRASAAISSEVGTSLGALLNVAFLSSVLLGPAAALLAAWRAEDAAGRRLTLVAASSLAGTALVMICSGLGATGDAAWAIVSVLLAMDGALVVVTLGCTRAITTPLHPTQTTDRGPIESDAVAAARPAAGPHLASLTPRELEVLSLLAEGLSNAGIAARLVLSERTVDSHLRSIFHKLDLPEGPTENRRVHATLAWRGTT